MNIENIIRLLPKRKYHDGANSDTICPCEQINGYNECLADVIKELRAIVVVTPPTIFSQMKDYIAKKLEGQD